MKLFSLDQIDKSQLTDEAQQLLRLIPHGYVPLPHQVAGHRHVDGKIGKLQYFCQPLIWALWIVSNPTPVLPSPPNIITDTQTSCLCKSKETHAPVITKDYYKPVLILFVQYSVSTHYLSQCRLSSCKHKI